MLAAKQVDLETGGAVVGCCLPWKAHILFGLVAPGGHSAGPDPDFRVTGSARFVPRMGVLRGSQGGGAERQARQHGYL